MSESIERVDDKDTEEEEEDTKKKKKGKSSDFLKIGGSLISNINYKVAFLLFVVGMLVFSDIFIDNVLCKFDDSVQGECTTTKGTMLQLTFIIIAYIVLDLTVKYELL
jgi:hypothetical protein